MCADPTSCFGGVEMQCPDPHFKKRHHKRRVVQKPLVDSILQNLKPGGKVIMSFAYFFKNVFTALFGLPSFIFLVLLSDSATDLGAIGCAGSSSRHERSVRRWIKGSSTRGYSWHRGRLVSGKPDGYTNRTRDPRWIGRCKNLPKTIPETSAYIMMIQTAVFQFEEARDFCLDDKSL